MDDQPAADAYLDKLPRAMRAGCSSHNHKTCLKGTREGVLWDIEAWEADKTHKSVYWLKGVAGSGKSTVAQTFAQNSAVNGNLGASFFCSRDYPDRRNLHLIFSTLAFDLAYWSDDFKTALVPIIRSNPNVQYDALPVQLEKLLARPFKQTGLFATIVVDALDECEDKEPVSEFLSALALHVDNMPTVKFFITGRPEDRIRSDFKLLPLRTKELPLHDIESAIVDSDIKSFLETRLEEIATRRRHSISGQWPSDRDITTILKKTAGLFIIAAVIVRFIDSPFASPQKRLKLIVDLPNSTVYEGKSGIDAVYQQILSASFENADEDDPEFFNQLHLVVGSIVLALKPLPRASLAEILEITPEIIWNMLTHLHSVLIVPESKSEPIRILHKSFADFVTDNQRCRDVRFHIDPPTYHSELGGHCLKLMKARLMKNICHLPRYAINNDIPDLPARQQKYIGAPLLYACSSWTKHLLLSSDAGDDTGTVVRSVNDFFKHHLLSWLEVLSIEENFYIAIYSLHDLRSWLTNTPAQDLLNRIDDCERFVLRSFDGMAQSAMHIYHSALLWAPTSSLTRKQYEYELMTKTELVNAVGATWDACIRIIPVGERAKAVLFSHKGALIATHGEYCVEIFDAMAGINRATFAQRRSISSVAFSPDDDFLVSGLLDGTIHIWEVQTGTLFRMFTGHIGDALSLAFSPCGTLIASGGTTGTVRIWNISSGCCDSNLQGHSGLVKDVCWLATGKQVISVSDDCTVCIWDIEQKTRSKIFAEYTRWVNAVDVSPASFLVASVGGNVIVYDSQSGDVIEAINTSEVLTRPRFSINGHEILLAGRNSGYVWDLTRKRRVQHIDYNGTCATFSPDGTCIASIYGMFLKIWKTTTGYKHHKASTHLHDASIDNVYISPDDRLVVLKSINSAQILDATTGQSLFTFAHRNIISIAFTPKFAFVACLYRKMDREWSKPEWDLWGSPSRRPRYLVEIWNAQTRKSDKFIDVDKDVFHIALSSDGSRLVSLSSSYMRLLDLESNQCLALWEFFLPSWGLLGHPIPHGEACVSFAINGRSVSVDSSHGKTSWYIFPMHNTYPTHNFGRNWWRSGPKPPMYFVPFTKERSYQDASAPSQSYHCGKNGEWILDQHGRHVLWIPLDERPRLSKSNKGGRTVVLGNEGGKFYIVNFSLS